MLGDTDLTSANFLKAIMSAAEQFQKVPDNHSQVTA